MTVEDIERLREVHDAGKQRDLPAAKPIRITAAVPVFVEAVNGLRHRLRKAHPARNRRSSLANGSSPVHAGPPACIVASGYTNQRCEDAFQKRRAPVATLSQGVLQAFPTHAGPVGQFDVAFGPDLIRRQNMEQFGRVAAASGVLEQKSVEEVRPRLLGGREAPMWPARRMPWMQERTE